MKELALLVLRELPPLMLLLRVFFKVSLSVLALFELVSTLGDLPLVFPTLSSLCKLLRVGFLDTSVFDELRRDFFETSGVEGGLIQMNDPSRSFWSTK